LSAADTPALVENGREITFSQLQQKSDAVAECLRAADIGAGDRVAVWLPNRSDWLVCLFALARLSAICVAVNTRFRAGEVEDIVGRAGCRGLVYEPAFKGIDFAGILRAVDPGALKTLELIVGVRGRVPDGIVPHADNLTLCELVAAPPRNLPAPDPDDGVIVFTTSGTTSKPKFVLHTQRSLAVHAQDVATAFDYAAPDTVLLQALPLCGTFGLAQAMAGIAAARPSVLMPAFDGPRAADLIRSHRVTSFNGSDEMLRRICDASAPGDLKSVKWCGFAAFSNARVEDFANRCADTGLHVTGLYGMSEVQALYARQPLDLPAAERARAGGVLTSPNAAVEIRDPHSGTVLAAGQSGELYLKGPSRMCEYMDNTEATSAGIGADGFVRSGDLGHLLADGRFVFETRMGDGIRLGGFLVNPAEIDAWLERHPGVAACQTVGVSIDNRTRPVSFVIIADGAAADEHTLIAHCHEGLAGFKVPERIFALEGFPTTDGPNGEKIQRGELRAMAEERLR
jgi:fatty-acyl-CoA synthase